MRKINYRVGIRETTNWQEVKDMKNVEVFFTDIDETSEKQKAIYKERCKKIRERMGWK